MFAVVLWMIRSTEFGRPWAYYELMSRRRILTIIGLCLSALVGCSDDAATANDAAADAPDATLPDAGGPDAFDPCPGQTTFQARVADWASDANLLGISVTDTTNTASSAPNGRVVLCIEKTGPVELHFTHASYVDRIHTTTGEIAAEQFAAGWSPTFRLLTGPQRSTLYASDGKTPDLAKATVVAMVRARPSGDGASGATLAIGAAHDGAYIPGANADSLVSGAVTDASGRVLFLDTTASPDSSSLQVAGLANCTLPAALALEAGGISSVSAICGP